MREEAPWVFVLREEILPGRFSIQPVEPSVFQLMEMDPKGDILFHSHVALLSASAQFEAYKELGWVKDFDVQTFAKFISDSLCKMLALKRVFVIPQAEFEQRIERGEFEVTRVPTEQERLAIGLAFHKALSEVLENYYHGLPKERQQVALSRMRPADTSGIMKLWGFSAIYDTELGGLRWRYINRPEVHHHHGPSRLPWHRVDWRSFPRRKTKGVTP